MSKTLRWFIATTLFLALAIGVEYTIGWRSILEDWQALSVSNLLFLTLLTFISYLLRAERVFNYFASESHSRVSYIKISFLHNALNNFLPMRLGEAAFPLLMKREFSESMLITSAGLLVIRLMDLHVLLLLASLALFSVNPLLGGIACTALILLPLLLRAGGESLISLFPEKIKNLLNKVEHLWPKDYRLLGQTYLMTLLIWIVKLVALILILMSFLNIDFFNGALAVILADISGVLPIHGLAGSGTYEAAMLAALYPMGFETIVAVKAAINVHIYLLGASLLSVPIALLLPSPSRNPSL
jgi:glycosyltransferase 2 family protein